MDDMLIQLVPAATGFFDTLLEWILAVAKIFKW